MTDYEKLKWQIHAETSLSQMAAYITIALLVKSGFWFWFSVTIAVCNLFTAITATMKLPKDYFK